MKMAPAWRMRSTHFFGMVGGDFQVLGRDVVKAMSQASSRLRTWMSAPRLPRLSRRMAARGMAGSWRVDGGFDFVQVGGVRAQQDGLRQFVVLGLGEQVHGDPVRPACCRRR